MEEMQQDKSNAPDLHSAETKEAKAIKADADHVCNQVLETALFRINMVTDQV